MQRASGNGWGVFLCNDEFVETQFSTTDKRRTELIHRDIYDASGNPIVPNQVKGYFSSKYVDPDFIGERTSARPYLIRFRTLRWCMPKRRDRSGFGLCEPYPRKGRRNTASVRNDDG